MISTAIHSRPLQWVGFIFMLVAWWAADAARANDDRDLPIHQLRVYEIFDDTRTAFHERFRDHATRIMKRYDFDIVATWESRSEGRLTFVYLLEWADEASMRDGWSRFLGDEEWSEIKRITAREHGQFVGEIEERTLVLTEYSPLRVLTHE